MDDQRGGAETVRIEDSGHYLQEDAHERIVPEVLGLLEDQPAARPGRRSAIPRISDMARERNVRLVIAALALLGVGIATYLTVVHYRGEAPVCAAGSTGCSTVTSSEYSELAGIPVPILGLVGYLAILASAAAPGDPGRLGGAFLALVGFGYSAYLTYLELFVIDAICQWCVASAIVMTLLLLATVARAGGFVGLGPDPPTRPRDGDRARTEPRTTTA